MEETTQTTSKANSTINTRQEKMTWDDDRYYDISYAVHRSRRYHAYLRDHYRSLHDGISVLTVFGASSAFFALLGNLTEIATGLTAIIGLGSLIDLLLGFGKKSELHNDLCRRFTNLAANIESWDATPENLTKARSARVRIECDEPSIKRLVDLMADNDEAKSRGVGSEFLVPLSWWQRKFGCFFTFGMSRLDKWRAEQPITE